MSLYVSVAEMRTEGVPSSILDAKIIAALTMWQAVIERICRQHFDVRSATLDIDGTESNMLHLPVPIISVTSLYINNDFVTVQPTTMYKAYTSRGPVGDDRKNPKITLIAEQQSIFSPSSSRVFSKGKMNQRIVGSWGYTEPDGTTPEPIKYALKKLAIKQLKAGGSTGMWQGASVVTAAGPMTQEVTDGHSMTYANMFQNIVKPGTIGLTGDAQVDAILVLYKGPIIVKAPIGLGEVSWQFSQ